MTSASRRRALELLGAVCILGAFDACVSVDDLGGGTVCDACTDGSQPDDANGDEEPNDGGADVAVDVEIIDGGPDASPCACVTPPPVGWQGPVALWEGTGTPPACSAEYSADVLDAFTSPNAPAATCGCSCGPVTGSTCPTTATATYYDQWCSQCGTVTLTTNACTPAPFECAAIVAAVSMQLVPQGGTCSPQPSSSIPPLSWNTAARACETAKTIMQGACASGRICAPLPASPMKPRPCIFASGDVACPGAPYTTKHTYFGSAADSRGCTPCTCGSPSGATCGAAVIPACSRSPVPVNATCTTVVGLNQAMLGPAFLDGGSCAPSPVSPTGQVTPTDATTVCCVP